MRAPHNGWLPHIGIGAQRGADPGLYVRARYLDTALGRWLSRDPLGLAEGLNLYGYVVNSPLALIDPSGCQYGGLIGPGTPASAQAWYNIAGGEKMADCMAECLEAGGWAVDLAAGAVGTGTLGLGLGPKKTWADKVQKGAVDWLRRHPSLRWVLGNPKFTVHNTGPKVREATSIMRMLQRLHPASSNPKELASKLHDLYSGHQRYTPIRKAVAGAKVVGRVGGQVIALYGAACLAYCIGQVRECPHGSPRAPGARS